MLLDLTTVIAPDHPVLAWARQQDDPHLAMGHVGTHLDVYERHDIPLEAFRCPGVLVDVRHTGEAGLADVDLEAIPARAFVIFRTGQIERHAYGEPAYFHEHPQLAPELITALLARKIRFIGIDSPGIRRHAEHEQADRLCERHGVHVIENLCCLEYLKPGQPFTVFTFWQDDPQRSGLPCRVIVEQEDGPATPGHL